MSQDIVDIGIHICLKCPYDECISTYDNLCPPLREEVDRIKADEEKKKQEREAEILRIVGEMCNAGNAVTIREIEDAHGITRNKLNAMHRRGLFVSKQVREKNKPKLLILGVKA